MSRHATAALLALCVLFAGCVGVDVPAPGTATSVETPTSLPSTTATPATTGGVSYDCPYYLQVEPASDRQLSNADEVLAFENLSEARQREFERALENVSANGTAAGTVEIGDTLPEVWGGPRVVEYEDEQYATVAFVC